jgi:hypothetical protein
MMFMKAREHGRGGGLGLRDLLHVAHREVVLLARADAAPLPQQPLDVGLDLGRIRSLLRRHPDRRDIRVAGDAPLKHAQRHEHDVVLVRAEAGLALGCQQSDHLARDLVDPDLASDRIVLTEQLLLDGLPDHAGRAAAAHLAFQEATTGSELPVVRDEIAGSGAGDRRAAVLGTVDDRRRLLAHGRHGANAAQLRVQCLDIANAEGLRFRAGASGAELAGPDRQQIAAELCKVRCDLGGRAVADRHHRNDRADADHDAERGEKGSQRIAQDRLQGQLDRLVDHQAASLVVTSEATRPSTKPITRRA